MVNPSNHLHDLNFTLGGRLKDFYFDSDGYMYDVKISRNSEGLIDSIISDGETTDESIKYSYISHRVDRIDNGDQFGGGYSKFKYNKEGGLSSITRFDCVYCGGYREYMETYEITDSIVDSHHNWTQLALSGDSGNNGVIKREIEYYSDSDFSDESDFYSDVDFYTLLDYPTTDKYIKVKIKLDEEEGTTAVIYKGREKIQSIFLSYDVDIYLFDKEMPQVFFIDVDFDGYKDIYLGPGESRTRNIILRYNPLTSLFERVKNSDIRNPLFCPQLKIVYDSDSGSAFEYGYHKRVFQGDSLATIGLLDFCTSEMWEEGRRHLWHLYAKDDVLIQKTDDEDKLPLEWRRVDRKTGQLKEEFDRLWNLNHPD